MCNLKSNLFLVFLNVCVFFIALAGEVLAADVTVSPVTGEPAQIAINNAIAAAGSSGTVTILNGTYEFVGHIVTRPGVNIVGESRDGVILKISQNAELGSYSSSTINSGGWGGNDDAATDGAIIMAWSNNVTISNLTLDGSCGDGFPCAADDRGHAEYNLMNIRADNVVVDNVRFTRGKSDGIIARGNNIEVSNCVFNMIGHDGCNTYGVNNLRFHNNIVAMRTNCGVRCSGSGSGCYVYNNEFYTGSGGAAAVELQGTVSNVEVYHNYFHDISGAGGLYGAIGYPGQSPTGSGHEYYDNLIVNCTYAIKYVPSSAVSHHNIIINSGGVEGGSSNNNITTESGYAFDKFGSNGARNTYWTVSSGSLAAAFSGIKVGIDDSSGAINLPDGGGDAGDEDDEEGDEDTEDDGPSIPTYASFTLTVVSGTGSGTYVVGSSANINAATAPEGQVFSRWSGDTAYVSNIASSSTTVNMPNKDISLTAVYKDKPFYGSSVFSNNSQASDFTQLVIGLLKWVLSVAGAFGFILIVIGGVIYISSAGDDQKALKGKRIVMQSLMGIAILLIAYSVAVIMENIFLR